ncbi:MAG: hypothetical protein U0457_15305 [Candidatus Sericytochromatia bacterium]
MTSIYALSEEMLSIEGENLYNSYYRDALAFINNVNKHQDIVGFLNNIDGVTFDNLFIKCILNLSNGLERIMNKVFLYAIENSNLEIEIKRKYRNIITSEEIFSFCDKSCNNLWNEVQNWNNNHNNFVHYHNTSFDNSFNAGYKGAVLGSSIGSTFGPIGSFVGGALGTLFAGNSMQNEYDSNYRVLINHYEALLSEFDNTWLLICDNLIPNIIGEVDYRFQNIKLENDNLIKEKNERLKLRKIEYISAPNNTKNEVTSSKNIDYENNISISKNNPIIYILASALVFSLIFIILIFLKVIHIS